jgi:hypothetical protein
MKNTKTFTETRTSRLEARVPVSFATCGQPFKNPATGRSGLLAGLALAVFLISVSAICGYLVVDILDDRPQYDTQECNVARDKQIAKIKKSGHVAHSKAEIEAEIESIVEQCKP